MSFKFQIRKNQNNDSHLILVGFFGDEESKSESKTNPSSTAISEEQSLLADNIVQLLSVNSADQQAVGNHLNKLQRLDLVCCCNQFSNSSTFAPDMPREIFCKSVNLDFELLKIQIPIFSTYKTGQHPIEHFLSQFLDKREMVFVKKESFIYEVIVLCKNTRTSDIYPFSFSLYYNFHSLKPTDAPNEVQCSNVNLSEIYITPGTLGNLKIQNILSKIPQDYKFYDDDNVAQVIKWRKEIRSLLNS